jgi:hypothetical protein
MDFLKELFDKVVKHQYNNKKGIIFYFFLAFISTFVINTSLGINMLNSANTGMELSLYNKILMFVSFTLMFTMILEGLCIKYEKNIHILLNIGVSFILSIAFIIGINLVAGSMLSNQIETSTAGNIANIYATRQYYSMDANQRKSIGNVYQFKKDLLNDIIYIENKRDLVKDKDNYETAGYDPMLDFSNYSFWNILGVLVYTDPAVLKSYEDKLEDIHERKLERRLKEKTESLHDSYSIAYKTLKDDFKNAEIQYNKQVAVFNNINSIIDKDYQFINNYYQKEADNVNKSVIKITQNSDLWAREFVRKEKSRLVDLLERLTGKRKCNQSCVDKAYANYNKIYRDQYNVNYKYWLVEKEKSGLTQALEETAKLVVSSGASLLYQVKPGYLAEQKEANHIKYDDSHFYTLAKNIYLNNLANQNELITQSPAGNGNIVLRAKNTTELKTIASLKNGLVKSFAANKGYTISANDILSRSQFNETAKRYYANKYKVKIEKPNFDKMSKDSKYQNIARNQLGTYYIEGMPLNYSNKDLADKVLTPKFKTEIVQVEQSIDNKEAYKKVIYPYVMLFFVTLFFLISSITFISTIIFIIVRKIGDLSNTDISPRIGTIITSIFMVIISIYVYNYDLSKSTDLIAAKEIANKLSDRSIKDELMINTIMFTYPIMIETEIIKEKYYINILTDAYSVFDKTSKGINR